MVNHEHRRKELKEIGNREAQVIILRKQVKNHVVLLHGIRRGTVARVDFDILVFFVEVDDKTTASLLLSAIQCLVSLFKQFIVSAAVVREARKPRRNRDED